MIANDGFKLVSPFPLYDPSIGEYGALRNVVCGTDYLEVVQRMMRYRLAYMRSQKANAEPNKASETRMLRDIARKLKARMERAEAQLWIHSEGRASYFEDYPSARPLDSIREKRA
jgi:hypothetical protein